MNSHRHIRPGFQTLTPYLIVPDAAQLIDFLKAVFDAEEVLRMENEDGTIGHTEMKIGDSVLELSSSTEQWPPMPASLHIYVENIDAVYEKALQQGAISLAAPQNQCYGERSASVRDSQNNMWHIATMIEETLIA